MKLKTTTAMENLLMGALKGEFASEKGRESDVSIERVPIARKGQRIVLSIPFNSGRARELHLVSHDIKELPALIGKLNFLIKVDLKLNHLTDLPPEFSKLGLLEQLNIAKNQFSSIPKVRKRGILHAAHLELQI